jgi:hypothetical protein
VPRSLVFGLAGEGFQHFAFVIDGPPKIVHLAVDLHEDLIQMPSPMGVSAHAVNSLTPNFGGEDRAETVPPEPDSFMADVDPTFGEKVFHIKQRQGVLEVHHNHEADDLGRAVEIAERVLQP